MRKIRVLYLLFLLPLMAVAQSNNIEGIVLNENSVPLPGVNVLIKGTNIGVSTDFDGLFSITVPEKGGTLMISYLGYESQELTIGDTTKFKIQLLPDAESLEEVVVVGYGTQRKSDLTGAVTSVKVSEVQKSQYNTVDAMLQGRAAGVQVTQNVGSPGSGVSVRIRGASSLRGNNEPLYVVDGVIISSAGEDSADAGGGNSRLQPQSGLNGINPRDIESMEILKDASATAIYGSRGANGVVLITTKKGKAGAKSSIQAFVNSSVATVTKTYDVLDGVGFAEYKNETATINNQPIPYSIQGGQVYPINYNNNGEPVVSTNAADQHDWQDELFKAGFSNSAGASFSGGSETGNYYISTVYNDQNGIVDNTRLQSGTFSINLNQDLSPKLSVSAKLSAFYSDGDFANAGDKAGGNRGFINQLTLYPPLILNPADVENQDDLEVRGPTTFIDDFEDVAEEKRYIGSINLTYKELFGVKGLNYKLQLGGNMRSKKRKRFFGLSTFVGSFSNGSLSISNLDSKSYQINNLFSYNKTFNKIHRVNAVLGFTYDVKDNESSVYRVENFSTTEFGVDAPQYGQFVALPLTVNPSKTQLLSYLSRVNYTLNNKYIFTGSIRADGSSKFSKENRFSYFPSFSLAWRADKEAFLENVDFINNLKLRAGWGATGNQGISAYNTFANYGPVLYGNTNEGTDIGFTPFNVSNPNLKWETTRQLNLGLDFGFFRNRLNGSVDVYDKQTDDLLLNQPLPTSAGFGSLLVNRGSINNKGLEFTLEGVIVDKNDFSIKIGGNIAFNRNTVQNLGLAPSDIYINGELESRSYYLGQNISSGLYFKAPANIFIEGEQIGLFYGFETDGIYQTEDAITISDTQPGDIRIIDQNGDNKIDGSDRTLIGDPNPEFVYGGNLNVSYKNLSLSAQFSGVYGNQLANGNLLQIGTPEGGYNNILTETYQNAWRPDTQSNTYPRIGYDKEITATAITDRIIEDGSFLRMSNITLMFNVPVEDIKTFKEVSIFISGQNLLTFTKYSGYDPEVTDFSWTGNIVGVDFGGFPNAKQITLGLNLNF
ncbi:TonB-linked outer membrane protein, SusC/RagA family [Lutibacter agarilyticus]|uniref:TonB-linked outer membrane protein, SusC/RagA family n=1 Tax=Lutibacter agarilyticus TaxID=1109740 RepID=A0A238Z438_9FLAO|nr:TonB-dependent receptor [Lutibacter agarilyticus]SNR78090.1 TonB-linked outer membrane protein, SusC/RagA family [Lutibacter agarilyticus]